MENKIKLTCPKDAYVSLQHIDKIYDNGVQAVFDFNLDIKKHEFIVFVGPSGCGKSTTLRMIAGLEEISAGHLFIDGAYVNDYSPKDRNIAMVFQSYALYPHMTVYNNMAFSLKINKIEVPQYTKESQAEIDICQKRLNDLYKNYHKVNKRMDELTVIKTDYTYAKRDLANITDEKKAKRFEVKVKKLEGKLKDYDQVYKAYQEYKVKIEEETKNLNEVKSKAQPLMAIDQKKVKFYEDKIKSCREKNDLSHMEELEMKLNEAKTIEVPVVKYTHFPKDEINRRIHEAAKILQIEEYLDRKPKALSGGQRQRVALGRAIVRNPKVFLMDEPLSNLDAKLRVQMRTEIVRLHQSLNATTIYVTHDQTEAMTMASRIVIMKLGRIQQVGTPIEIYQHPVNMFVAGFIGSPAMNFFDAKYSNGFIELNNGMKFPLPIDLIKDKKIPDNVVIGIRPEDIHQGNGEHAKEFKENIIELNVHSAELLGSEYYVHSDFANKDLVCKLEAKELISAGDKIKVCINLRKIHIFDKDTELTII